MSTLHQYYEMDFPSSIKLGLLFDMCGEEFEFQFLHDFEIGLAYCSCFIPGEKRTLEFFLKLASELKYGVVKMRGDGVITLPSLERYHGDFKIANEAEVGLQCRLIGDPDWVSYRDLRGSGRFFIYSESELNDDEQRSLKEYGREFGHSIIFRGKKYMDLRTAREHPLAFISHDSKDKEVARKIAVGLQDRLCPVWYDEFSLDVGDNLRTSIERGLKECKKCVLLLSPNFIANEGWTKREFDSIFTREVLEKQSLVLPVWYNIESQAIYDYCPSLLNVFGLDWNTLGEEKVCGKLLSKLVD